MELFIRILFLLSAWIFGIVCESVARDFFGKSFWDETYRNRID